MDKPVSVDEYGGLFNRPKHSGVAKVQFSIPQKNWEWRPNLRAVFKGPYGVSDKNGNEILDADNEYIQGYQWLGGGYVLLNTTLNLVQYGKERSRFRWYAGVDNIFDFKEEQFLPQQPGRTWYSGLSISLQTFGKPTQ